MGGLPAAFTSFVGRRQETAEVRRLLGGARLVTLTGAGGVGKTRLALEVAGAVERAFPGGVWLVDLAPVRDPELVVEAAAVALGVVDQGTRPVPELLAAHVAGRRLLVVLDNCEHLVEACARLAGELLSAAPELRILATSRETLQVTGEHVVAVAPLAPQDAAELLAQRAAAVRPGFRLTDANRAAVDRLCADLDGLPLAIELAASRLRTLAVEPVIERLADRFALLTAGSRTARPHQRTLRAAIDWSWDLCGPAERLLWSRLSVFAGSFTLEAAEGVCADEGVGAAGDFVGDRGGAAEGDGCLGGAAEGAEGAWLEGAEGAWADGAGGAGPGGAEGAWPDGAEKARADTPLPALGIPGILDVLDRLVTQSLVEHAGTERHPRYRLLESIRQYGAERLAERGEEERLRRRHRDFFLRWAERRHQEWTGPHQAEILNLMHAEHGNLMAALEYRSGRGDGVLAPGDDGHAPEPVGAPSAPSPAPGPGDSPSTSTSTSTSISAPVADRQAALALPAALAFHWIAGGCLSEGRRYLERALAAAPEPTAVRARALLVATQVAYTQGDFAPAHRFVEEADGIAVRLGDTVSRADARGHRGALALCEGRLAEAVGHIEGALGGTSYEVGWRCALGIAQTLSGDERAPGTSERALAFAEGHGERWARARLLMVLGRRAWELGERTEARQRTLAALTTLRGFSDSIGVAHMVEQLAWITAADGDHQRAGQLLGTARALRENVGLVAVGGEGYRAEHARCAEQIRGALGPSGYERALADGAAVSDADVAIDRAVGPVAGAVARTTARHTAEAAPAAENTLTGREEQVVALVARGMTNRRIAAELVLSPRTVDNHVNRILTKLGFSSRAQIAAWWAAR